MNTQQIQQIVNICKSQGCTNPKQIEKIVLNAWKDYRRQQIIKARTDFKVFVKLMFKETSANIDLEDSFHTDLLSTILQFKIEKKFKQDTLIISIPPGHSKTLMGNVLYTAWIFGVKPSLRIINAGNSQDEVNKRNVEVRDIMQSTLYNKIFPEVKLKGEEKTWLTTNFKGGRRGVTTDIAKRFTGGDADFLLVDDPNDTTATQLELEKTNEWYIKKALRRLRPDARNIGSLIIQQRVNQNDLTGFIKTNNQNVLHICLKAYEEEDIEYTIELKDNQKLTFIRPKGFLWQPKTEPLKTEVLKMYTVAKQDAHTWETQYQQNPVDAQDVLIKNEWWRYYTCEPLDLDLKNIFITCDLALTEKTTSDYSVVCAWGVDNENKLYLLDGMRTKARYNEVKQIFISFYQKWNYNKYTNRNYIKASQFFIEDVSVSKPLIDDLKRIVDIIKPIPRNISKTARMEASSTAIANGFVFLPKELPFTEELVKEAYNFRADNSHRHDDIVDNLCDAIEHGLSRAIKNTDFTKINSALSRYYNT